MAKKNKPSGKRPAMFYQPGSKKYEHGETDHHKGPRMRIFYPNGDAEWSLCLHNTADYVNHFYTWNAGCCWNDNKKAKNFKHALELAKEFDKEEGFPEMIFIGEL